MLVTLGVVVTLLLGTLSEATLIGSVADIGLGEVPAFQLVAELASAGDAAQVASLAELAKIIVADLDVAIDGSTVTITGAELDSGADKLADDADFQLATADPPAGLIRLSHLCGTLPA